MSSGFGSRSEMHFGRAVPVLFRRFPKLEARNLEGKTVKFPSELPGELNFVMIGFQKKHNIDMDRWWNFGKGLHFKMREMHDRKDALHYQRLFIHSPLALPFRPFLERHHAKHTWDTEQDERTYTAFKDQQWFCEKLGLPDPRRCYAMIVTKDGEIEWVDHEHGTIEKMEKVAWRLGVHADELEKLTSDEEIYQLEEHWAKIDYERMIAAQEEAARLEAGDDGEAQKESETGENNVQGEGVVEEGMKTVTKASDGTPKEESDIKK